LSANIFCYTSWYIFPKWWPEAVNQRTKHLHSPLAQYIPSIIFTMYFYPWLLDTFYCKVATHKKITKYCYNTYVFKIATIHLCSRLLQYICVQDCYNTLVYKRFVGLEQKCILAIFNDMFYGNYLAILYGYAFWQSLHQSLVAILNTYVL
jgi:hypothetical protein